MLIQDTLGDNQANVFEVTCYKREVLSDGFDDVVTKMQAQPFLGLVAE